MLAMLERIASSVGITPVNSFFIKEMVKRFWQLIMSLGILPENLFPRSSRLYTKLQCSKDGSMPDKFEKDVKNICRLREDQIFEFWRKVALERIMRNIKQLQTR